VGRYSRPKLEVPLTLSEGHTKKHASGESAEVSILEAVARVPRERFVDPSLRNLAYDDYPLPIGNDQTISSVETVIRLCTALDVRGGERVLEIGTGSGYQAAVLTELGCRIYSVERVAELSRTARRLLDRLGYQRVLIRWGDGGEGWEQYAPFDRIVVTAACPSVPSALVEQLNSRGRMVLPLGPPGDQRLVRVAKGPGGPIIGDIESCNFVPLVGRSGWSNEELAWFWRS